MRIAALSLGILGGLFALVGTVLTLTSAGVGGVFGTTGSGQALVLGIIGLIFALLGLTGAVLSLARPTTAGFLMLVAAIGGTIAITGAFLFGGLLLLVGGVLALFAARREHMPHAAPARA